MMNVEQFPLNQEIARDLEIMKVTRGQLVALVRQIRMAEGMGFEQATIHARMLVDQAFIQSNAKAAK